MQKLKVETKKKKEVVDITEKVADLLDKSDKKDGLVHLFLLHTTAGLTTADLDPGTDEDIVDALTEMVPKLKFRHPHDPTHAPDHILSTLVGTQISVPFSNKKLILGSWQRVVLVEFDGPRTREVVVNLI